MMTEGGFDVAVAVPAVSTHQLSLAYGPAPVTSDLDLRLERGQVTAIVGPNGCGKSTILRSLARMMRPTAGVVHLDGDDIERLPAKTLARKLAMLPQSPEIPNGVTVWDLVGYGRFPHQGLLRGRSADDLAAMEWAIDVTGMSMLRDRAVDTLSGGERQRAWVAMALAQRTDVLLLDEPTTFLDMHFQIELLTLVRRLNREHGLTVGWVLHDLNQAAAYSDRIIMLRGGRIVVDGPPEQVMTPPSIKRVFGIECCVINHPLGNTPMCLPNGFCPFAGAASAAPTIVAATDSLATPEGAES
jgi:ferric hydroxamate transport system ATP-binding protein